MWRCTVSHGMRSNAPISGGPNDSDDLVKRLDGSKLDMYRQVTLPARHEEQAVMTTRTREEIRVGPMAIRFLIEGEESGGSVSMFEFDVPAGTTVAAGHSHDGYEETIYGLDGSADLDDRGRGERHRPR